MLGGSLPYWVPTVPHRCVIMRQLQGKMLTVLNDLEADRSRCHLPGSHLSAGGQTLTVEFQQQAASVPLISCDLLPPQEPEECSGWVLEDHHIRSKVGLSD